MPDPGSTCNCFLKKSSRREVGATAQSTRRASSIEWRSASKARIAKLCLPARVRACDSVTGFGIEIPSKLSSFTRRPVNLDPVHGGVLSQPEMGDRRVEGKIYATSLQHHSGLSRSCLDLVKVNLSWTKRVKRSRLSSLALGFRGEVIRETCGFWDSVTFSTSQG